MYGVQENPDDRNTELLATADVVYNHILQGEPGHAISLLTSAVPWVQTEACFSLSDDHVIREEPAPRGTQHQGEFHTS